MTDMRGTKGDDNLSGGDFDDVIRGLGGNDTLWGGSGGFDQVFGGSGDDEISDSNGGDVLVGGSGFDTLVISHIDFFGGGIEAFEFNFVVNGSMTTPGGSTADGFERVVISGGNFNDTITGGKNDDQLRGWNGDDVLDGKHGDDFLIGDNGADTLRGGPGNDTLTGGGHSDILYGGEGDDILIGGRISDVFSGSDTLIGGPGADEFHAGNGSTTVSYSTSPAAVHVDLEKKLALGGDDRLEAGWGSTVLTGGPGKDTFAFKYDKAILYNSPTVADFNQQGGEKLDLSLIDANPAPGKQAFVFIGGAPFVDGQIGQVRVEIVDGRTVVQMNMDRFATVEHTIYLNGEYALTAADFIF
jgi:Ca2+-binding RTX toxin-like protein